MSFFGKVWSSFSDAAASLQCKVTGVMVILTFSVAAMVSGYLLQSSGQEATKDQNLNLVRLTAMLSKAVAITLQRRDSPALQALVQEAANGAPLLYVVVVDRQNRVLASAEYPDAHILSRLNHIPDTPPKVPGQVVIRGGKDGVPTLVEVTYPIRKRSSTRRSILSGSGSDKDSELAGYLRTAMPATGWYRIMASQLDFMVGIGILATVAAIPLGFFMIRHIVSPLDSLSDAMVRFSRGKLDVRSSIERRDEIGRLALAFNRMADQHQNTHQRIVRLNEELEKRVALRTQQLRELASRDPLTGLFNRRYFNEMLERRFSESFRYQTDLSCIMIDLDGFKAVNDAFGHHTGDTLLQLTADTIIDQLRSSDVAARFGGDEFVALLPQTDVEQALVLGQRIMDQFRKNISDRFSELTVSMSMGIASTAASEIDDAESLVRTADHALYEAKDRGKNRIVSAETAWKPTTI